MTSGGRAFGRTPRSLTMLLIASLALNCLFLGMAAAAMWRLRGPGPTHAYIVPNLLGYASTLPSERRKQLWDLSEQERQILRPFRREVRMAREEVVRALAAEPFNREEFMAAQARQGEAENRARAAVDNLYAKIASGLTLEERRNFQGWRHHRRPPGQNLLDEPDQPANAR